MKKSYIAAALALTGCMVMGAAAVSQPQNVTATFRPDITLKVNGTAYTVRDTNGAAVSPLIYNGTTYLPLASIGRMLDVDVSWDAATNTVVVTDADTASAYIGEAKAKETALSHAGLSSGQVTFLQVKLDWEDGRQVYEVEFYSGSKEYDYEIDAATGAIVGYDYDIENYTIPSSGSTSSGSYISREKAQQLAQAKAPNATLVELEFDFDDGRAVYEGELRDGRVEYEFEIDASTGAFIKWEQDWDD